MAHYGLYRAMSGIFSPVIASFVLLLVTLLGCRSTSAEEADFQTCPTFPQCSDGICSTCPQTSTSHQTVCDATLSSQLTGSPWSDFLTIDQPAGSSPRVLVPNIGCPSNCPPTTSTELLVPQPYRHPSAMNYPSNSLKAPLTCGPQVSCPGESTGMRRSLKGRWTERIRSSDPFGRQWRGKPVRRLRWILLRR